MSTPTPAQPGAYDFDETSELDSETAFAAPAPVTPMAAAKAILVHFQALEKQGGGRIPLTFKNQMLEGRWDTKTVGIPVTLLRDLEAAFTNAENTRALMDLALGVTPKPVTTQPFLVLDAAERELVDLYSGR